MKKIIILLPLLLTPILSHAKGGEKTSKFYTQGMLGLSATKTDNIPGNISNEQTPQGGTALTVAFGHRWNHFALEMIYARLGRPEINVADYYTEKHNATFLGGGLHWTWTFFDLKLGWGNAKDKLSYTAGPLSSTFSASPNGQTHSNFTGYLGLGLNFDLGKDTELVIDYTGYGWTYKHIQNLTINGTNASFEESTGGMGVLSIGMRWFI